MTLRWTTVTLRNVGLAAGALDTIKRHALISFNLVAMVQANRRRVFLLATRPGFKLPKDWHWSVIPNSCCQLVASL